jgi:hypothetical protein
LTLNPVEELLAGERRAEVGMVRPDRPDDMVLEHVRQPAVAGSAGSAAFAGDEPLGSSGPVSRPEKLHLARADTERLSPGAVRKSSLVEAIDDLQSTQFGMAHEQKSHVDPQGWLPEGTFLNC